MSPEAQKELDDFITAELEAYALEFIQDSAAQLRRRGAKASGELVNSFEHEVRAQSINAGIQLLMSFEDHGRFIDMRSLQPPEGGRDYILNIIRWMQNKGLTEKFIKGYMRRRKLKRVPERVLTYIAFGIARKRFSGKFRRTRWYNKRKTATVSVLFDNIRAGIPDIFLEELKRPITRTTRITSGGGVKVTRSRVANKTLVSYARAKGRE
jgi:hypothetical protein